MHLVIVESPSKAKTITKYLGKDYIVKASKGHVVDLPKSQFGIEVENNFRPQYEVTNTKALTELRQSLKEADSLILAVDLDREGEAIGWHLARALRLINEDGSSKADKPVQRIVFSEISKEAIQEAIKHPRGIDINLVNSQQARRVLDRVVGYKLSPLLWKKITFGLSAGRVQSVALRLIVEREEERDAFNPDEYWSIESYTDTTKGTAPKIRYELTKEKNEEDTTKKKGQPTGLRFELTKINKKKPQIPTQQEAENITTNVAARDWVVSSLEKKVTKRYPKPPFITSTMQQTAVNTLGFSAKRTMVLAQKLYEAGHITYMRTDSVHIAESAIQQARTYIQKHMGKKYLPEKVIRYSSSNKSAQEAHECIRPVDVTRTPEEIKLTPDEKKLYSLIWKRTLASMMSPAEVENNSIVVLLDPYEFRATGSKVLFEGFMRVYQEKINEFTLPQLEKGATLYPCEIVGTQHFTQPPPRYSEASLIKKLEELGIGRPSTYASIISTIQSRKYVINENKYLRPTDTGSVVNKLLVKYFPTIMDYGFTANMEQDLDSIAEGKRDWVQMMRTFYDPFAAAVEKNEKEIPRSEFTELGKSDIKCPECGSEMVIKLGRYGKFLSCSQYPTCKGMLSIDGKSEEDLAKETETDEFKAMYDPAPQTDDGRNYILKMGRYGRFWAHPDYPKVKDPRPLKLTRSAMLDKYGSIPQTDDGRDYVIKKGRFGEFWAHPDYPDVKDIVRIPKKKNKE